MQFNDVSSFLHTPAWEEFLRAAGQHVEREDDALFVRGKLPGGGCYWRSSRLRIERSWTIPTFTKKAWFLRLEPLNNEAAARLAMLGKLRATDSYQPKQTVVIDLSLSEEELLANMKSKHRYNIRLAEKHEVTVELIHENAAEHFDRFWGLLTATAGRHDFKTHARGYYKKMIETLASKGMAHLGFARLGSEDLATVLLLTHDKTITYLHGGSAASHKDVMAPFTLHWEIMKWAKSHNFKAYDLWGTNAVHTEDGGFEARKNHPSNGTTRFKLGFGGEVIQYPGSFDLVLKPIPYTLYRGIRKIIRRQSSF
jgi:peptidoglycan pentaglycine glycine transferase (the first glycine)